MNDNPSLETLLDKMRYLKLPGMVRSVEEILDRAATENLTSLDLLHRLLDEERASRLQSAVKRRIHEAKFPELNSIDGFDFDFNPSRKKVRTRYLALHDLSFIARGINPLFVGTPGAGKTFLARALALKACQDRKRVVFTSAPRMLNELHGAELHGSLEKSLR